MLFHPKSILLEPLKNMCINKQTVVFPDVTLTKRTTVCSDVTLTKENSLFGCHVEKEICIRMLCYSCFGCYFDRTLVCSDVVLTKH